VGEIWEAAVVEEVAEVLMVVGAGLVVCGCFFGLWSLRPKADRWSGPNIETPEA
jgi:hypothetical protein